MQAVDERNTMHANTPAKTLDDLSMWVGSGRVYSQDQPQGSSGRSVGQAIDDVADAEALGIRRAILSERYNLKHASTFLGIAAGRTSRIDLATGVMAIRSRHPLLTAAMGATMHAAVGPRLVLGVGKSEPAWIDRDGAGRATTYQEVIDYVDILRRLWRGERVTYSGPAGRFAKMALGDCYEGPPPQVWYGTIGNPLGARTAAHPVFDGAMLWPCMTPDAVRNAVTRIRGAAESNLRDPSSVRIIAPVITAPELSDHETRALAHARLITYATWPGYAEVFAKINNWALEPFKAIAAHPMFTAMPDVSADLSFHREELMDPASLVPNTWIEESCAIGSVEACAKKLKEFKDAGADEIATYGSTPAQNAALVSAWRDMKAS
jgi:5,10-methylenetetrahydromethanopterin reductase